MNLFLAILLGGFEENKTDDLGADIVVEEEKGIEEEDYESKGTMKSKTFREDGNEMSKAIK